MLRVNIGNAMEEVLGEKGLTEKEVEALRDKLQDALSQIKERRWKELAFLDLPEQDLTEVKKTGVRIKKEAEAFLLLGIGGSALGPKAILHALSPFHNSRRGPYTVDR